MLVVAADVVLTLVLVVVISSFAGRLLGLRRSWLATMVTGVAGWAAGSGVALLLEGSAGASWKAGAWQVALGVAFMMVAQLTVEFLRRPNAYYGVNRRSGLPHPIRGARAGLRRSRRYSQVVRIAVNNGLGPHVGRRSHSVDEFAGQRLFGKRLRLTLEQSGGMFIKLGQVLSTRSDLLPPDIVAELSGLQDDVTPARPEDVRRLVEEEIGAPLDTVFMRFDWQPIAAASIAQVHDATLIDGREVVVKVQRPDIDELVEQDLDALIQLAASIERHMDRARRYQLLPLAREFAERLREEIDFRIEAANISAVRSNLEHMSQLQAPQVEESLVSRRVLTMEKLNGFTVRDGDRVAQSGFDRERLADDLLGSYLQQVLVDGVYHADPHPGNVLLLENGRIGLIDFGAVGRIDALEQGALKEMLLAMGRRDPEMLLVAFLDIVDLPPNTDLVPLQRALGGFVAKHLNGVRNPSGGTFIDLLRILVGFGAVVPPELSTLFRTLATLQGTIETLAPGYAFVTRAQSIALEVLGPHTVIPFDGLAKASVVRAFPQLRRLPRHVDRIATLAERGDLRLRVSLLSTAADVRAVTRLVNRLVLSGLGVGVGIVAVVLLGTTGGPALEGGLGLYALLGYVGLLLSTIFVVRVAVAVLRDGLN